VLNDTVHKIIQNIQIKDSNNPKLVKLRFNIDKVKNLQRSLNFDINLGKNLISAHFGEQSRLVQLLTELKIQAIKNSSDVLLNTLKSQEKKFIAIFSNKINSIQETLNPVIEQTDQYLQEKMVLLDQNDISEDDLDNFIKESEQKLNYLESANLKANNQIFDNQRITFNSNEDKILIGDLDWIRLKDFPTNMVSTSNGQLKMFEIKSNKQVQLFQPIDHAVVVALVAPKNILISGFIDGSIKKWNIITGECVNTIKAHDDSISCIIFISIDSFASSSDDKK